MKKIFVKPQAKLVNAETANMICASTVQIGVVADGSATQAEKLGWTVNSKQSAATTYSFDL